MDPVSSIWRENHCIRTLWVCHLTSMVLFLVFPSKRFLDKVDFVLSKIFYVQSKKMRSLIMKEKFIQLKKKLGPGHPFLTSLCFSISDLSFFCPPCFPPPPAPRGHLSLSL